MKVCHWVCTQIIIRHRRALSSKRKVGVTGFVLKLSFVIDEHWVCTQIIIRHRRALSSKRKVGVTGFVLKLSFLRDEHCPLK